MPRTRTPPDLKWVLNERAAVAGELQAIEAELARLTARRLQLGALLHHLDHVYSQLAPQAPAVPVLVVNARKRYGGRGNCIAWVRETLRDAYPQALTTAALTEASTGKLTAAARTSAEGCRVAFYKDRVILWGRPQGAT